MNLTRITWFAPLALALSTACGDSPLDSQAADDAAEQATLVSAARSGHGGSEKIEILDECDPADPAWAPTGGCLQKRGNVTAAEFGALLQSGLSAAVVGHPGWTNEPSYLEVRLGKSVRVTNEGGRFHTLTPVAAFGGGRVPPLNFGLTPAPECALAPGAVDPFGVAPGGNLTLRNLRPGINRLQCCIHPWMRELINVSNNLHDHGDRD